MVYADYQYANSVEKMRELIAKDARYRAAYENTLRYAHRTFSDNINMIAGWGHNFACPYCAKLYPFMGGEEPVPPKEYLCPNCGKIGRGRDIEEGWAFYYRLHLSGCFASAVVGYLLGDSQSEKYFYDYMNFYADHYAEFAEHGKWVGHGKMAGQSLDEAVLGSLIVRVLMAGKYLVPKDVWQGWYRKMFRPMADFLFPQAGRIHNISMWIQCCVGAIGVCFDDAELLDKALNSEFGLRAQIRRGFTADGIWRECSLVYHYYVAQSLSNFLPLYATVDREDEIFDVYEKIFTAPLAFSEDGKRLQAINDGWYPLSVDAYVGSEEVAARILHHPQIDRDVSLAKREGKLRPTGAYSLLFDVTHLPDEKEMSAPREAPADVLLYPATNFAFLRKPFYMILKSGAVCFTHMHRDYLSVILPPFSDDLGTPAYSHPMMNTWFKDPPAHNAVCVDYTQPCREIEEYLMHSHVERRGESIAAVMEKGEWKGISRAERVLTPLDDAVLDVTVMESEEEHTYDWFFHSAGEPIYSAPGEEHGPLSDDVCYAHLTDIRKMACGDCFEASFILHGKMLRVSIPVIPGMEVFTMHSPSNPVDCQRNTIVLRVRGKSCRFEARFAVEDESSR